MTIGVFYYSRTGNTRKAAELLVETMKAKDIQVDLVEIEAVRRPGFLSAGSASTRQKELPIKNTPGDLGKYGLVVFGVPVWAGNPCPMVKTFLSKVPGRPSVAAACFLVGGGKPQTQDRAVAILKSWVNEKGFAVRDPVLVLQAGRGGIVGQSTSLDEFLTAVLP